MAVLRETGLPCPAISSIRAALRLASMKSASVIRSFFIFFFGFIMLWFYCLL